MIATGSFLLCLIRFFLSLSHLLLQRFTSAFRALSLCLSVSVSLFCLVSTLVNERHTEVTCCSSVSINPGFLKKSVFCFSFDFSLAFLSLKAREITSIPSWKTTRDFTGSLVLLFHRYFNSSLPLSTFHWSSQSVDHLTSRLCPFETDVAFLWFFWSF